MRNHIKLLCAAVILMLAAVLSSCGAEEVTSDVLEEYTGTLKNAMESSIIISNVDDNNIIKFTTNKDTVYDIGDETHLCANDVIRVVFHEEGVERIANQIELKEHVHQALTFEGTVSDVKKESVTLTDKALTVTFIKDSDTKVQGDLSKADEAVVTYTGDISEYPYATEIKVIKEKEEADETTVSGIVSELEDGTVLLAVNSATAYRFKIDKNTKIKGEADKLTVGDSVNITFKGDIEKTPAAIVINIVKKAQEQRRTINGTIKSVGDDSVTLDTGKKTYKFATDKYTKFNGDKPAKGYKSEITYVGELGKDATAIIVYCVKQTPKPVKYTVIFIDGNGTTLKTEKVVKGGSATAPDDPEREGYTFTGWDTDFSDVTSDLVVNATWKKDEPDPEEPVIAQGTLLAWTDDGTNTCTVDIEGFGELTLFVDPEELDIPIGYMPAINDIVKISYLESSSQLRSIELISRPDAPEPEPEPTEDVTPDDTADQPADDASDEAADEPAGEADVTIVAEGVIVEGDESNRTVLITVDDEDIELKLDADTNISSGYFPEKGDTVQITYDKNSMALRDIQLLRAAEPEAADEPAEEVSPAEDSAPADAPATEPENDPAADTENASEDDQ